MDRVEEERMIVKKMMLVALFAWLGCQGMETDESEMTPQMTDGGVKALTSSGPVNCVGQCVAVYRMCVRGGDEVATCAADREACKEDCNANTCEPGDTDCCGGPSQPACP
jgi:hypothetical protein